MKRFIQFIFLSAVLGGVSIAAQAQSTTKVKADLPFDFSIGDKSYEAGEYNMRVVRTNSSHSVLQLMNKEGNVIHAVLVRKDDAKRAKKGSLQFEIEGEKRRLSSLRTGGHQYQILM